MSNKKMSLEDLYSNKVKSSFVYKINKLFTLYKAQTSKYFSNTSRIRVCLLESLLNFGNILLDLRYKLLKINPISFT